MTQEHRAKLKLLAAERASHHSAVIEALRKFAVADMRHAGSNGMDDYLEQLQAEHALAHAIQKATGWDLWEVIQGIAEEARSECSYSFKEECFLNYMGVPIND